jgi:ABC-2 type transport system ATP-binding protein
MVVLQIKNLKKYFRKTKAVDDISFEINQGEIVGLLGPNGAGKTTTTQILLGTLTPTAGEIFYFGQKFTSQNKEVLKKINFASAYIALPWRITVWENLDVYARMYEVKKRKERIKRLLKAFEVYTLRNKAVDQLSAGQKTRVLLAKAFINYPQLLLLDEPTASLDPEIAIKVRKFLLKQQKEYQMAMLFTSHNLVEVQEICDRIIVLNKGKIVAQDSPENLIKKIKTSHIKMIIIQNRPVLEKYLQSRKINFSWKKNKISFSLDESLIPKILYQISAQGVRYEEIEILRPTLEDFFLEIIKKT